MFGRTNHSPAIGVDVGSTAVRAAQVERRGNHWAVTSASVRARTESSGSGTRALASDLLSTCLVQGNFVGRKVTLALSADAVEFVSLDLPAALMQNEDIGDAAALEIERLVSRREQQLVCANWALPAAESNAPNTIGVAASSERIYELVGACEEAGYECCCIDTWATALARFGTLLADCPRDVVRGILDIGHVHSGLVLCVDDVPVLVRMTGKGGQAWTQRIAESLQISMKSADVEKCRHGIGIRKRRHRDGLGDHLAGEGGLVQDNVASNHLSSVFTGVLRGELEELAAEVKRSYEYALSCYASRHAGDLILVGRSGALRNLAEFFSEALGIPVRQAGDYLAEDACRLKFPNAKKGEAEELALALGLALPAERSPKDKHFHMSGSATGAVLT